MAIQLSSATADDPAVVQHLLQLAAEARERNSGRVKFVDTPAANALLNDLRNHPHAFVLACLMNRQVKAERAWLVPFEIQRQERLGSFEIGDLARLKEVDVLRYLERPTSLHWLTKRMARTFHAGVQRIVSEFGGDASRIWADAPPSARIVRCFLEFEGAGPKIATMAANLLVSLLGVSVSDRYSIDISPDRHVRRVFSKLGFVPEDADNDLIVYRARELSPEYPGAFDLLLWEVGRTTCGPKKTLCSGCQLSELCRSSNSRG